MITKQRRGFALALILAVGSSAQAADETAVVMRATKLLEEISSNPKSGIPPRFLQEARGIMIVPHIVENQLGVGRKKGHGVFLPRNEKGEWGNPDLVEISGGSVGAEVGRMVSDRVMIYRTQEAADKHAKKSTTLGFSLTVDGSLNLRRRFSGPRPDSGTEKDILTYTRERGVLVGAKIYGEYESKPTFAPEVLKTPPTPDQKAAGTDTKVAAKVTQRDAPAPNANANAKLAGDSPEVARLKTVLAAMTTPPPAQVAATRTKDPKVSPASGAKPPAETAAPPR